MFVSQGYGLLLSAAVTLLGATGGAFAADDGNLRFGVVSDVHLWERPGSEKYLERAFVWFRDQGADGVMIAGDTATQGRIAQLKLAADAWYRVFPGDKGLDGRHVEKLFIYGNHCINNWKNYDAPGRGMSAAPPEMLADPKFRAQGIGADNNRATCWKELFHEEYRPIWRKTVKGYVFIGAHWGHEKDLPAFMAKEGASIDPRKPFFYVQHPHPKGTCVGDWAWGAEPNATAVLSKYPNAVAFTGHSHYSLTDERSIWQGAFTSVNAGSLGYTSLDYDFRDNTHGTTYSQLLGPHLSGAPHVHKGKHALFVTVTEREIRLERLGFFFADTPEKLGDDWVIPLPMTEERPYAFAPRAAKRVAPAFDAGAKVTLTPVPNPKNTNETDRIRVNFPHAHAVGGCRVFEYEVQPLLVGSGAELPLQAKRVIAAGFDLSEKSFEREERRIPAKCVFATSAFPKGATIRFEVRPVECFGKKGPPIVSEALTVE